VLSGINVSSNLGNSIWHSGTLAAAKQAVLLGTRGIALSTPWMTMNRSLGHWNLQ
jgi:5'-nucleotidase